ncbi:MAG: S1 RNA-binding domain-containing protein [Candidatus Peribacteria bacterium]|jgi:exoribonuclease R|nr:S1 RNA-binding domain-containing protein [Candidatus Peribacteria bacterium]
MIPKGFFVELPDTSEGFVEMQKAVFDDKLWTFTEKSGKKYTLGDSVKVKLIEVDMKLFRLNFKVI